MRVITFGEPLLRFTTDAEKRLHQVDQLAFYFGGAEANLATSLSNFGHEVEFVSAIPPNSLGSACKKYLKANGVGTNYLMEQGSRLGTYYVETGIGNRQANVTYDRAYSSFHLLDESVFDWDQIFLDVDHFHTTGITLALSEKLREITLVAMQKAKEKGITVSFDFNYRAKLWSQGEARIAIQKVLPYVDVAFCNQLDAIHFLDIEESKSEMHEDKLNEYYQNIVEKYPNISALSSTKRMVHSSNKHELEGYFYDKQQLVKSKRYVIDPVVDRIGGGDAYAAAILHGWLKQWPLTDTVDFATASSVLKHTIKGDSNAFTELEVKSYLSLVDQEISR